jgi:ABC-type amino acid transport substrate-binding protein
VPRNARRLLTGAVLALTLAASLLTSGCTSAQPSSITTIAPGTLRACLYPGFKPFAYKDDGIWKGWDVDYLSAFARANHLRFEPVEVKAFEDIWLRPGKDECDVAASGISDTEARRKASEPAARWSATYYTVVRAFLVRTADARNLTDVGDLRGKTVVVTLGSTADYDLRNRMAQAGMTEKDVTIQGTDDEEQAADLVRQGSAFAYGGGYGSVKLLATHGLTVVWPHCNLTSVGDGAFTPYSEPFSFVVRAKSAGLSAALDAYIPHHTYAGTPNPPSVTCPSPPWAGK